MNKKFEILKRENAIDEAQRKRHRDAMFIGACSVATLASIAINNPEIFNGSFEEVNRIVQLQIDALGSYEALKQYFQELGPATTFLAAATTGFFTKYLRRTREINALEREVQSINEVFPEENELGDNEHDRTR